MGVGVGWTGRVTGTGVADSTVRFSWILLGRNPHNERKLYTLYCALLAQGSNLSAANVARMADGLSRGSLGRPVKRLDLVTNLTQSQNNVVRLEGRTR